MLPVIQSDACPLTGVVPVCPAGRWLEALRRATTIGTAASTPGMIRKLKSGEYRLYSRKRMPQPASAATWARFRQWRRQSSMSAKCSISKSTNRSLWLARSIQDHARRAVGHIAYVRQTFGVLTCHYVRSSECTRFVSRLSDTRRNRSVGYTGLMSSVNS